MTNPTAGKHELAMPAGNSDRNDSSIEIGELPTIDAGNFETIFRRALLHHEGGRLQEAGEIYRELLAFYPDHGPANHNMGRLAGQMGAAELGLPYLEAALASDPQSHEYWLSYIDGLFQAERHEDARSLMRLARRQGLDGEDVDLLAQRIEGAVFLCGERVQGQFVPSLVASIGDKASNKEIDSLLDHFARGEYCKAEALARRLTAQYPADSFGWKALGALLQQDGRNADALEPMRRSVELAPGDVEARYNLGLVFQKLGQFEEAERCYRSALTVNPNYSDALANLGVILHQQGILDEAETCLTRALQFKPGNASAHCNLGLVLERSGRLEEAASSYRQSLSLEQSNVEAHKNLGAVLRRLGQLDAAELAYRRSLDVFPDVADLCNGIGIVLQELGRFPEAEVYYRRAFELKPDFAEAYNNLGHLLSLLDRSQEAESIIGRAIEINQGYAEAYSNLGAIRQARGDFDEAEVSFKKAIKVNPSYAMAYFNLGHLLNERGRLDEAESYYRRALTIAPDQVDTYIALGNLLVNLGKLTEAEIVFRRGLGLRPRSAEANFGIGNVKVKLWRLDDAIEYYRLALDCDQNLAGIHGNLGVIYLRMGRFEDAASSLRKAVELEPDYYDGYSNLGAALKELGQYEEAFACCRRALDIDPKNAGVLINLGNVQNDCWRFDEAAESFRKALQLDPDFASAYDNLVFVLSQDETIDPQALFVEHCRFGEHFESNDRTSRPRHSNSPEPERQLNVGIISADFRDHSIAYFVEPVLEHLALQHRIVLHAFYNHYIEDSTTGRLKEHFKWWNSILGMSDEELEQLVRNSGIDILIDLSGHTAGNRLVAFARKMAPIQCTWMGYPGTTGLRTMDYFLTDRFFVPELEFGGQFTEAFAYLPASAPFLPQKGSPDVRVLPALATGNLTYASFNRPSKITRQVVALWAQILRAVPNSRLLLAGMPKGFDRSFLINWFETESISLDRLIFHSRSNMDSYLSLHHEVDICLDTFPFNGGTTTLHALWMGVPTLTLAGAVPAARSGASILGHVGLEDFVADSKEGFVEKGVAWARQLDELHGIRSGLRNRMSNSAMGQPRVIAESLDLAFRKMWKRWCEGLSACTFDARVS